MHVIFTKSKENILSNKNVTLNACLSYTVRQYKDSMTIKHECWMFKSNHLYCECIRPKYSFIDDNYLNDSTILLSNYIQYGNE